LLLGDNGTETRHLALDPLTQAFDARPDVLHERFTSTRRRSRSGRRRRAARMPAARPKTSTPSSSARARVSVPGAYELRHRALGLRHDVIALDLVGQGCGAAIPNLRTAEA
jgi:alkylresorcinol/alkylpyrone synthase